MKWVGVKPNLIICSSKVPLAFFVSKAKRWGDSTFKSPLNTSAKRVYGKNSAERVGQCAEYL